MRLSRDSGVNPLVNETQQEPSAMADTTRRSVFRSIIFAICSWKVKMLLSSFGFYRNGSIAACVFRRMNLVV